MRLGGSTVSHGYRLIKRGGFKSLGLVSMGL